MRRITCSRSKNISGPIPRPLEGFSVISDRQRQVPIINRTVDTFPLVRYSESTTRIYSGPLAASPHVAFQTNIANLLKQMLIDITFGVLFVFPCKRAKQEKDCVLQVALLRLRNKVLCPVEFV